MNAARSLLAPSLFLSSCISLSAATFKKKCPDGSTLATSHPEWAKKEPFFLGKVWQWVSKEKKKNHESHRNSCDAAHQHFLFSFSFFFFFFPFRTPSPLQLLVGSHPYVFNYPWLALSFWYFLQPSLLSKFPFFSTKTTPSSSPCQLRYPRSTLSTCCPILIYWLHNPNISEV